VSHVAPERWADLAAGRVSPQERTRLEAHAASCDRCAAARARVEAARRTLSVVRETPPPTLGWDLLGARAYWTTSSELRRRERAREGLSRRARRGLPFFATSLAIAGALTAVFLLHDRGREIAAPGSAAPPAAAAVTAPAPPPAPAPAPAAPAAPLDAVVTLLQGDARLGEQRLGEKNVLDAGVAAGDVVSTGRGRVALQFGARSGLLLEPESTLEIVRFDSAAVELRVAGAVSVELEGRAPGQRFAVLAGDRRVEVRGTVFRVAHHAGDLDVAVRRGTVAVIDGDASVEVAAGARLALARAAHLGAILPRPMLASAADALAASMRVPLVAGWTDAAALRRASGLVAIAAASRTRVTVDGVEVGSGSLLLRAAPGRHLIEAGTRARWIEVEAGAAVTTLLDRTRSERPGQVDAQLRTHRADVGHCAQAEHKATPGFQGSVEIEVGINADGSVNFVAPVRGSASPSADACILNLIRDRFTFPAGTQATVRKVINF
jgi:hypothetical protein